MNCLHRHIQAWSKSELYFKTSKINTKKVNTSESISYTLWLINIYGKHWKGRDITKQRNKVMRALKKRQKITLRTNVIPIGESIIEGKCQSAMAFCIKELRQNKSILI